MSKIEEKDIIVFERLINDFEKANKVFPKYDKISKDPTSGAFISLLKEDQYYEILINSRIKEFDKVTNSSPAMKKLTKEMYESNKIEFIKFMKMNLDRENIFSKDFQEIGDKFNSFIIDIEDNLLKKVEGGKFSTFSGSIDEKFKTYIKRFFPLINNVGVKIKKKAD